METLYFIWIDEDDDEECEEQFFINEIVMSKYYKQFDVEIYLN